MHPTGTAINMHPGNLHLRSLVAQSNRLTLEGSQKRRVAGDIVQQIQKLGGRFLIEERSAKTSSEVPKATNKRSYNDGGSVHPTILAKKWLQASSDKAVVKVMQRMREKTAKQSCSDEPFNLTHQDNDSCISTRNETTSTSSAQSSNIEIGGTDELFESLRTDMFDTSELDHGTRSNEHTLRSWIEKAKTMLNVHETSFGQSHQRIKYIKAALPIALKLVDILIEAENEERSGYGNPIPLDTINAGKRLSIVGIIYHHDY